MNFKLKRPTNDELNEFDIMLLDTYILDYYGIKVFFQVCKTKPKSVCLVELATKKTKYGIMLTKQIKASKKPLIITENNTYTKSQYEVYPINLNGDEYWLPIPIDRNSPIYKEALQYEDCPSCGIAYAVPIKEIINMYWDCPEKKKEQEQEENIAYA